MSDFLRRVKTVAFTHQELFASDLSEGEMRDHISLHHLQLPVTGTRAHLIKQHRRTHRAERRALR